MDIYSVIKYLIVSVHAIYCANQAHSVKYM